MAPGLAWNIVIVLAFVPWMNSQASPVTSDNNLTSKPKEPSEKQILLEKWKKLEEEVKGGIESTVKRALPTLLRFTSEAEISSECQGALLTLAQGLLGMKTWAFELLDASGKPTSGILMGTVTSLGAYEECLNVQVLESNRKNLRFRGKYCTVEVKPPLPSKPKFYTIHHKIKDFDNFTGGESIITKAQSLVGRMFALSFRFGVCIPSTCEIDDLRKIANLVGEKIHFDTEVKNCEEKEETKWTTTQVVIGSVFLAFAILNIICTIFHLVYKKCIQDKRALNRIGKPTLVKLACSFSLLKSFPSLYRCSTTLEPTFLHAFRALSLGWVVLGSVFLFLNTSMLSQMLVAVEYSDTLWLQFILNGTLGVETLFFTSAYLLGYTAKIRKIEKGNALYFFRVVLGRYFRITPVLLCVIGMAIMLPLTTSGPMWREVALPFQENCVQNWWTNVLFINNFISDPNTRCLYNSWYLSCEMQLFILGLFFIALLGKVKRSISLITAAFLTFAGIVATGVITAYFGFPPTILFSQIDVVDRAFFENLMQQKPFSHLSTWFMGLLAGYYFTKLKKVQVRGICLLMGWMATITVLSSLVFGIFEWNRDEKDDTVLSTLYAALYRPAWSLCLVFLSFVCSNGNAVTINGILSWSGWIPLSRIFYFFYLIFPLFQDMVFAQGRELVQVSLYLALFLFSGVFVLGGLTSLLCSLLVQQPVQAIVRVFADAIDGDKPNTQVISKISPGKDLPTYDRSFSVTSEISTCSEVADVPDSITKNKRDSCVPLSLSME